MERGRTGYVNLARKSPCFSDADLRPPRVPRITGNQDFYDQVNPKVMSGGKLPDGCQLHIAGPIENGWRVITVWDSEEQFEQFRNEKLIPAIREIGAGERIAPNIETSPVYKLITA